MPIDAGTRIDNRKRTTPPRCRLRSLLLLAGLAASATARGQSPLTPYGSVQAEYNSNIFSLPDAAQARLETGDSRLADESLRLVIGLDARLPLSQQTLRAKVEGRRYDFLHLNRIDHNEYLIGAGLDWDLAGVVAGTVDARQERRLAPFTDRISTTLTLERERILSATASLDISDDWLLQAALKGRTLASPLPDFPRFALDDNSADLALKYRIGSGIDAGVYGRYGFGKFNGVPSAGRFDEQSLGVVTDYTIDSLSRLSAQAGYTRRQDRGQDPNGNGGDNGGRSSAITGKLSLARQLSGKTAIGVDAFRRVNSYVGDASTVQETGAGLSLNWTPTVKIAVAASYQYGFSRFRQSGTTTDNSQRRDDSQVAALQLLWQAQGWLTVRPYAAWQTRSSTTARNSFDALIAGLELGIRL